MSEIAGTGRHLGDTELRLWTSFLDASRMIESEIAAQLVSDFGMTHREYEVLVRIDGAGAHMRLSELARRIEASPALVSQTVNRLEERGWLNRTPSPDDRRGVQAALTDSGRAALAEAAGPHAELIRKLLIEPIDCGDVEAAARSLGEVADHLRSHRAGTGCDDPDCPVST